MDSAHPAELRGAVIDIDPGRACWQRPECSDASELVFLFHEWEPAVRVAIHAYVAYPDCEFDAIEPAIDAAYQRIRGRSPISRERAAPAARRVWQKLRHDAMTEDRASRRRRGGSALRWPRSDCAERLDLVGRVDVADVLHPRELVVDGARADA